MMKPTHTFGNSPNDIFVHLYFNHLVLPDTSLSFDFFQQHKFKMSLISKDASLKVPLVFFYFH